MRILRLVVVCFVYDCHSLQCVQLLGGPSTTFDSITNNVLVDLVGVTEHSDVGDSSWNVVQLLTTAFTLCRPVPVFRPELLSYVARMYGAWTVAVRVLQHQVLTIDDELRPARLQVGRAACVVFFFHFASVGVQ